MREIVDILPHHTFSSKEKRHRAKLEVAVMQLPAHQQALLERAAVTKLYCLNTSGVEEVDRGPISRTPAKANEDEFFETVSEECRCDCISKFIDATGNKAIAMGTCAVCAGSFFLQEIFEVKVSDLRLKNKLTPSNPHPAQELTDGMLLHRSPESLHTDGNGIAFANVCLSCYGDLRRKKTPAMSLANGMWIGEVPLELKILTLPERILVAWFFPAAYIIKLYPKKKGARNWSTMGLHSALRGNVSTYRLNTDQIAHLANSHVMPPSSTILAATIGVTFVGPRNIPQKSLPGFLRVNRNRVRVALDWLKENNPLYANITISAERLDALPVDGIPEEIITLAKFSDDTRLLAEEQDNYVPCDMDNEEGEDAGEFA